MKPIKTGTKTAKVLSYLQTGHSLDIPKATAMWGCIRLSDAIFRLRKKGYPVQTKIVQSESSDVQYAIYRLPRMPSKDTPLGTKVRVLVTADCADEYHGQVGIMTKHLDPGDSSYVVGSIRVVFEDLTHFNCLFHTNELEVIQ